MKDDPQAAPGAAGRPYKKVSLLEQAADEARKAVLYRALAATNGDVARAAKNLGTNRSYCYALLKRYGITIERQKLARVILAKP